MVADSVAVPRREVVPVRDRRGVVQGEAGLVAPDGAGSAGGAHVALLAVALALRSRPGSVCEVYCEPSADAEGARVARPVDVRGDPGAPSERGVRGEGDGARVARRGAGLVDCSLVEPAMSSIPPPLLAGV